MCAQRLARWGVNRACGPAPHGLCTLATARRQQNEAWGNLGLLELQKPHKSRLTREKEAWAAAVRSLRSLALVTQRHLNSLSRPVLVPLHQASGTRLKLKRCLTPKGFIKIVVRLVLCIEMTESATSCPVIHHALSKIPASSAT